MIIELLDLIGALLIFLIMVALIITGLIVFMSLVLPIFKGPPYVPTAQSTVKRMLDMADIRPGERVINLGSGDGRYLIEAAKRGASAYGYELNPLLVWLSGLLIKRHRQSGRAKVICGDFWKADLADYDVVVIYGRLGMMKKLEQKMLRECRPGTRIMCNAFNLPNLSPTEEDDHLYLYHIYD